MTVGWGVAMIGLLARLMRIFWRQDSEGSRAATPAVDMIRPLPPAPPPLAQVEFVRSIASTEVAQLAPAASQPSRHLAPRLQSVARLNAPSGRVPAKARSAPVHKPRPVLAAPVAKRRSTAQHGQVLDRMAKAKRARGAEIIDLAAVRRERQVELLDLDIAAIFN